MCETPPTLRIHVAALYIKGNRQVDTWKSSELSRMQKPKRVQPLLTTAYYSVTADGDHAWQMAIKLVRVCGDYSSDDSGDADVWWLVVSETPGNLQTGFGTDTPKKKYGVHHFLEVGWGIQPSAQRSNLINILDIIFFNITIRTHDVTWQDATPAK